MTRIYLCLVFKFFLAFNYFEFKNCLFIRNQILNSNNQVKNDTTKCRDPSELELEMKLLEFENKKTDLILDEDYVDPSDKKQSHTDEDDCDTEERYSTNKRALCTFRFVTVKRLNSYPRSITQVRCTCSYCQSLLSVISKKLYKCLPLLNAKVFLSRAECGQNKIYNWVPKLELIPQSCSCKLIRIWKAF